MLDYDWQLLMDKLNAFEEKLKKLENDVLILNRYVDTQLNNKYYPNKNVDSGYCAYTEEWVQGRKYRVPTMRSTHCMYDNVEPNQAMGLVCNCPKHSAYALSAGNFRIVDYLRHGNYLQLKRTMKNDW